MSAYILLKQIKFSYYKEIKLDVLLYIVNTQLYGVNSLYSTFIQQYTQVLFVFNN